MFLGNLSSVGHTYPLGFQPYSAYIYIGTEETQRQLTDPHWIYLVHRPHTLYPYPSGL